MKKPIKVKSTEKLTAANIEHVIGLLNPTQEGVKPISKKLACEILCISYNTTRLTNIIEAYLEKKENVRKRKEAARGKPLTDSDIQFIIEEVLLGAPISGISEKIYRSATVIKKAIESLGIPGLEDDENFGLFPEQCIADSFDVNEVVYYPKYDTLVVVDALIDNNYIKTRPGFVQETNYDSFVFKLYKVYEKNIGYHTVFASDLASLKHLSKYGVNFDKLRQMDKYSRKSTSE